MNFCNYRPRDTPRTLTECKNLASYTRFLRILTPSINTQKMPNSSWINKSFHLPPLRLPFFNNPWNRGWYLFSLYHWPPGTFPSRFLYSVSMLPPIGLNRSEQAMGCSSLSQAQLVSIIESLVSIFLSMVVYYLRYWVVSPTVRKAIISGSSCSVFSPVRRYLACGISSLQHRAIWD